MGPPYWAMSVRQMSDAWSVVGCCSYDLRSSPSRGRAGHQARYRKSRHHAVVSGTDLLPAPCQHSCTSDVGYGAPASGDAREDGSTSSLSFSFPAPVADRQLSYTSQVSYSGSGVGVTAPGVRQDSYCGSQPVVR